MWLGLNTGCMTRSNCRECIAQQVGINTIVRYRPDDNILHTQICVLHKYRSADSLLLFFQRMYCTTSGAKYRSDDGLLFFFQIIYCTTSGAKYRSDDSVMDCAEPRTDCWQLRILHSPLLLQLQSFYYCNPVPLSVLFVL